MNDHPKRNTPAGEAPQRATSGQNVPKSGARANAGTRRRNGAFRVEFHDTDPIPYEQPLNVIPAATERNNFSLAESMKRKR